jgi:hypothetical protein
VARVMGKFAPRTREIGKPRSLAAGEEGGGAGDKGPSTSGPLAAGQPRQADVQR